MLAEKITSAAHAGEDQASPEFSARLAHHCNTWDSIQAARREASTDTVIAQAWSIRPPAIENKSLTTAILGQQSKPLAGTVVYVTEVRHHVVTDDDLNAAARVAIGGAA